MNTETASRSFQDKKNDETKSGLDSLMEKVEKSDAGKELAALKSKVLEFPIFEGEDENGDIYESITVKEILENPINIVKGLGIEAIDSYPFLEGIYKWIFLKESKDYEFKGSSKDEISKVADEYYLDDKRVKVSSIEGLKENEVDVLSEIQKNNGPSAEKVLDVYNNQKDISKQLEKHEFLELVRDIGLACEDYNMQKDIYIPYVLGLIKKESAFKKMAWNRSGATGFGQHMTQYLPSRLKSASLKMNERGLKYDKKAVEDGVNFFKQNKEIRKDRDKWPEGVEELAFGSQMQSYMTIELTNQNLKSLQSSLGERAGTYELYDYLYLAHNMGIGNAKKIAKGEELGTWAMGRLQKLKDKKIIEGVSKYSVKMRTTLYGKKEINVV